MFKHIALTYLSQKIDTSLENQGGGVASRQGVPTTVRVSTTSSRRNASYSTNKFGHSVKVSFYAVSECTTEMQKTNSRSGKQP